MSTVNLYPPTCSNAAVKFEIDGQIICKRARTMDYICPLVTHYIASNRDQSYSSYAPGEDYGGYYSNGEEGFCWDGEYGYVGMSALGKSNIADGMNEVGFSGGALTLNVTQYQTVPEGDNQLALSAEDIFKYLFSTCKTVEEAKENLNKVYTWRCTLDNRENLAMPLLHFAVHDAQGGNGAVEYVNGNLNFYDKTVGVLTNDPVYPSQHDALQNYVTFTSLYGTSMTVNDVVVQGNYVGNCSVGMPGSTSPMDRFARLSLHIVQMQSPKDKIDATTRMWNLIYNVWAQPGSETFPLNGRLVEGYTRWAVNMDLTDKTIETITDRNRVPQKIDLKEIDFSPGTSHESIPIYSIEDSFSLVEEHNQYLQYLSNKV
jgi:choloylglycine hydrolase